MIKLMFDSEMSMKVHVSAINRSAYPQLKNLKAFKTVLDKEASNTLVHAIVSSHCDAGNSTLYGIVHATFNAYREL